MNKSYISIILLLIVGTASVSTISARYWRGGYGRYNYDPYYDDSGAAIAGNVIGGLSGMVGAGIAASEARKTRKQEERLSELERKEYEQRIAALEEEKKAAEETE